MRVFMSVCEHVHVYVYDYLYALHLPIILRPEMANLYSCLVVYYIHQLFGSLRTFMNRQRLGFGLVGLGFSKP